VTLEWAELPTGQWHVIGTDLPNSGKHVWRLPSQMPSQVYLRLSVRDQAGNIAVAATQKPVLIDLTPPEFRVLGVHP
jgi:hypothetical protein